MNLNRYPFHPTLILLGGLTLLAFACAQPGAAAPQWTVFETALASSTDYGNPFQAVDVTVAFTSPSGARQTVDAFWDGGDTWRVRFSPDELGGWTWESRCSDASNQGLHNRRGNFRCVPYTGDNPLYQHGPLKLSASRRHIEHADGTPFFWLGCTAWNGVLRARPADWDSYLAARREQDFTAIQFVATHWRGLHQDAWSETAFTDTVDITLNPAFFQRLDPKVAAINAHGLVAAPVVLWTLTATDPGQILAEPDAIRLARYIVARWGAYQVVWLLGGDGRYPAERVDRWKRIGRAVFGDRHDRLVTLHPSGRNWVANDFGEEKWFDIVGYQSGHGDADRDLRWLTTGPPATLWNEDPAHPVINLEPNYETHAGYTHKTVFRGTHIRRAAYWSLMVSPPAGVTFGHNAIWVWPDEPQAPDGHSRLGIVGPWREGVYTEGARSMTLLYRLFDSLPWPQLRPAQGLLADQPGEDDPNLFVSAAQTGDGRTAVFYAPEGVGITVDGTLLPRGAQARWYNPRDGQFSEPFEINPEGTQSLTPPDRWDWVLVVAAASP
ncbi:hypothetical protein ES707_21003 [subsurface metagenome]